MIAPVMLRKHFRIVLIIVLITWTSGSPSCPAADRKVIGLRAGISDGRNHKDFQQYEGFVTFSFPWVWQFASTWRLEGFLEANAGVLRGGAESAFVGSAGPGIKFSGFGEKIDIPLGVNATYISDHTFGDDNFGGPIQFTSHIGLNYNFSRHFMMGYRLQHMSNAGIYSPNPGVNIHMLAIGYHW